MLSAGFGVSPGHSLWSDYERMQGLVDRAHWVALAVVLASVLHTPRAWRAALKANLAACTATACIVIARAWDIEVPYFRAFPEIGPTRFGGPLGNPGYLSIYMLVNLVLAAGFAAWLALWGGALAVLVLGARAAPPPERALTMFAAAALAGHLAQIQFMFDTVGGTLVATLLLVFAARLEPATLTPARWLRFPAPRARLFGPSARAVFSRPGARAATGAAAVVLAVARLAGNGTILKAANTQYTPPGDLPIAAVAEGIEAFPPAAAFYRKYLIAALARDWRPLHEQDPEGAEELLRWADREATAAVRWEPWNWRIEHLLAQFYRVVADTRPDYEARASSHLISRARTRPRARGVSRAARPAGGSRGGPPAGRGCGTALACYARGGLSPDCPDCARGGVRRLAHHPLRLRPGAGNACRARRRFPLPHQGVPVSAGLQSMGAMAVIAWRRGAARPGVMPDPACESPDRSPHRRQQARRPPAQPRAGKGRRFAHDPQDGAWVLDKALGVSRALRPMQDAGGRGAELGRAVRSAIRAGALRPLARRLAGSARAEHRELGALLGAAIAEADDATALALVSTAAMKPDVRAEKIVSNRYRFVWICNPKAASRSLIAALRAADPDAVLIRHRTLEQVLAGHPEAGEFFRFAFLRHPYHRTRSFHADKHALARRERDARRWFIDPWQGLRPAMSFAEFCRWLETPCGCDAFADRHWLSQSRQVATADGRMPDFLGRFETLEADWRAVSERLRLPPVPLPRLNVSDAGPAGEAGLHGDIAALLRRRYAEDFVLGGYGDAP